MDGPASGSVPAAAGAKAPLPVRHPDPTRPNPGRRRPAQAARPKPAEAPAPLTAPPAEAPAPLTAPPAAVPFDPFDGASASPAPSSPFDAPAAPPSPDAASAPAPTTPDDEVTAPAAPPEPQRTPSDATTASRQPVPDAAPVVPPGRTTPAEPAGATLALGQALAPPDADVPAPPAPPAQEPAQEPADAVPVTDPGPSPRTAALVRPRTAVPAVPFPAPESVPTVDPRLAQAVGRPLHGDSVARRTGQSIRRLAAPKAQPAAAEARLARELQVPVASGRIVAVTSIRGGVGKTTTAALVARALQRARQDPVLALEADAALGTLAVRLGAPTVRWSISELAQILTPSMHLLDITGYLVPLPDGGWLLPASQGRVGPALDIPTYRTVTLGLRPHFAVTVADCETLPGEVARTAMDTAHARVVVAPMTVEGVGGTRVVLDWLSGLPHSALSSTVVALTSGTPDQNLDLGTAVGHLRETGVGVVHLPYDRHLAAGGPIREELLSAATHRAAAQLAAEALQRAVRAR
ncbi:hypothetical protein [Streptomyces sp. NPDC088785]|uniref:nucleotide-binding protein n=1 Tax=Streptomyces sp. NPDC088785 TaxID=3365897 RepID=UPI0038034732